MGRCSPRSARLGSDPDDTFDGAVDPLGHPTILGFEQIRHDLQHPLHQRPGTQTDAGEAAHETRLPDGELVWDELVAELDDIVKRGGSIEFPYD